MQNNIQNNWKSSLDDPGNFPGEIIRDKNEAWEKLYTKLHETPKRRFPILYWAAAASLIIAIITIVLFANKETHQGTLVGRFPAKKQIPAIKENTSSIEQKNSEYVLEQPKQKIKTVVSNQKNILVKTIPLINKTLIADSIIEQLPKMIIIPNTAHDSSIKTATVATPAKKKLKVVHVNEIGQPIDEPMVNNRFTERPFEFRISNGEIYNAVNSSSSNNGLILTKPRSTSN